MNNPFYPWLQRLEGKAGVTIHTHLDNNIYSYDGCIVVLEKEVCLFKERNTMYLFRVKDICEISGELVLFHRRHAKYKPGISPFWRWLKQLEGKEVKVVAKTPTYNSNYNTYNGHVLRVETDLCLFEENDKGHLFNINDVVEVYSDEPVFNLKAEVTIEEIEE